MIDLKTGLSPLISAFVVAIDDFSQAALSIFDLSIQIDADWRDPFTLNIRLGNTTVIIAKLTILEIFKHWQLRSNWQIIKIKDTNLCE